MLIELGQVRRTSRRTTDDAPVIDWPSYDTGAKYLYSAKIIADLVAKHYGGAYQYTRPDAVRMADGDIRQDQRFYDTEYKQAAEILATTFPTDVAASDWYMFLRNKMGYRLVDVPFCSYGMEPDPVTRKCVTERVDIPRGNGYEPIPGLEPKPPPYENDEEEESEWAALIIPLGIVGIIALVMLGGGR